MEKIKMAAIKFNNGTVVENWDHASCYMTASDEHKIYDCKGACEGFVTTKGRFVTRYEASKIAIAADQISGEPRQLQSYEVKKNYALKETVNDNI